MKSCAPEMQRKVSDDSEDLPRICLVIETFYPVVGGGETQARFLAEHMISSGMPVFVVTRRSHRGLPIFEMIGHIPTHRVPPANMRRRGKYAMAPFVFSLLIRLRRDYDLIYVCGFRVLGAPAVLAATLLGKKCVLRAEAQGEMSGAYASAHRRLPKAIEVPFSAAVSVRNRILRWAHAFIAISQPIAREFLDCGVKPDRLFSVPNGVDTQVFTPVPAKPRQGLRRKLGLPEGATIAVYSGKLNRGKGLEHLLQAWEAVASSRSQVHLLLVGSGGGQSLSCEAGLRDFVRRRKLESVTTFTGYVQNVHEYLQSSDLFVLPSENEGLPVSMLEAMSCGLPVIATRIGGIPEAVNHLETGILVDPADPAGLAEAINLLLDRQDLAGRLGQNARRAARDGYSIAAVGARYRELFSSLCASDSEPPMIHCTEP